MARLACTSPPPPMISGLGTARPPEALTTAEREELARLRRENKRLQMERDILKAAATFFAKESE